MTVTGRQAIIGSLLVSAVILVVLAFSGALTPAPLPADVQQMIDSIGTAAP